MKIIVWLIAKRMKELKLLYTKKNYGKISINLINLNL